MSAPELLARLRSLDVKVWVEDGDRLRVSAPREVLTAELQRELSQHKSDVIAYMHSLANSGDSALPQIRPTTRRGPSPLSYSQRGLWFVEQLTPGTGAYNVPLALPFKGPFDLTALEQSLTALVHRHAALRTTFQQVDGEPVQVVSPPAPCHVPLIDLRRVPGDRAAEVERLTAEHVARPFDLSQGPLFRAVLIQIDDDEYQLVLNMHHIVSDGWSLGILFRELSALYAAYSTGKEPCLPELPVSYGDYSAWQQDHLSGGVLEQHLTYWKQALAGDLPVLDLPLDHPRPKMASLRGAVKSFEVDRALWNDLTALSRQEGATLFMTLMAAFNLLLHRYTGQSDLTVGTPVAGRNRIEVEGIIGLFVNSLVLRTDASGDPTFRELLGRVRETTLAGFAHQDLPFELLVEALHPDRDTSRSPLFQVMLAYEKATLNPLTLGTGGARYDLTLFFWEQSDRLTGLFEYSTDLFDADTIDRMVEHLMIVLRGIVARPDARLSEISLLSAEERHRVLVDWNATEAAYPTQQTIHGLFAEQARRTPQGTAVVADSAQLTYQQLDAAADRVAQSLLERGVGRGVPVAVCLDHSPAMVAGLLGVLRAGGAYLPLDASHPLERLAFQLSDSQAPVLLTERALLNGPLHGLSRDGISTLCLEEIANPALRRDVQEAPALDSQVSPDDPAYLIYTSGSTGQPKAVLATHRGAINRFAWMWNAYPFQSGEVACQKTTLSFVDSVWELFGPLLKGVPLVLASAEARRDPRHLVALLAEHGVTRLVLVPSLIRTLTEMFPDLGARLPRLRLVVSSGEALPGNLARQFELAAPGVRLLNLYGSSEIAADATAYDPTEDRCADRWRQDGAPVPIGRPIANMRTYVLDLYGEPVPVGARGELYVGGDGLALGYLHRPELTDERFVPDPFSSQPGARLYKTGDLARWRADGQLEYLGRRDHQVKLRGVRIDLGEVEAALRRYPAIAEAVVICRESSPGDFRLGASVVLRDAREQLDLSDVRAFLRGLVPEAMVPASITTLDALPLTPSGKVDRTRLRPDENQFEAAGYIAPRTPTERALAELWAEALGVERVGIRDDFFDLGGHSLLAVRLFARIEEVLGQHLPLMTLFEGPTIEQIAGVLDLDVASSHWPSLVTLRVGKPGRRPFFCIHPIDGDVAWYEPLARSMDPDQPFYGLRSRGLDAVQEPFTCLEEMAAHYIGAIRSVQPEGPYRLGGFSFGGSVAFEMARQLREAGESVEMLAILDAPPVNSDYFEVRWTLSYLVTWFRLLPERIRAFLWLMDSKRRFRVLRSKVDVFARLLGLKRREPNVSVAPADLTEEFLAPLIENIARLLYGSSEHLPPHHRDVVVANAKAAASYTPKPYPGRVTLFRAEEQPIGCSFDPEMGWTPLAAGGVDVRPIAGSHLSILQESNVEALASALRRALECPASDEASEPVQLIGRRRWLRQQAFAHQSLTAAAARAVAVMVKAHFFLAAACASSLSACPI